MAEIFSDTFTRSNEELGASSDWTERNGDFEIVSNEAAHVSAGANSWEDVAYNNSGTYSSADYEVEADVRQDGGNPQPGVVGRRVNDGSTSSDYYGLVHKQSGNEVNITKRLSGSQTELVNDTTVTINDNTAYNLRIKLEGATQKGFLDDVEINASATDSDISAAGDAGLLMSNGTDSFYDNFLAATLAADVVIPRQVGSIASPGHVAPVAVAY